MTPLQLLLVVATAVLPTCMGKPDKWQEVTVSQTGAPCWFDMKPNSRDCAVCSDNGQQCGYPMHNYCRKNNKANDLGWRRGCKGIRRATTTLSQTGYPCPWDPTDRSCPWCSEDSILCTENGRLNCYNPTYARIYFKMDSDREHYDKHCKSQQCTEFPEACHANATCKEFHYRRKVVQTNSYTGVQTFGWTTETIHRCVCNSGYIGNGVTCADATTGLVFDNRVVGKGNLRLNMNLSRDATVDEGLWDNKPLGENTEQVYSNAENIPHSGQNNCTTAICTPVGEDRKLLFRDEL